MKIKVLNTDLLTTITTPCYIKHGVKVGNVYEVLDVKDAFYGIKTYLPNENNETGLWYLHKDDVEVLEDVVPVNVEQSSDLKVGDIGEIVSFSENNSDMVLLDIFENTKQYIYKEHIEKVGDVPSKFILINDTGLSLDKVNSCLDILRAENGLDSDELNIVDELLVETLSHLQQLMGNLEKL